MKHEYMKQKSKLDRRDLLRDDWTSKIAKRLVGLTIERVTYTQEEDMEDRGWHQAGVQLHLDDGTVIVVQRDSEGNGPGSLDIYHQDKNRRECAPTI